MKISLLNSQQDKSNPKGSQVIISPILGIISILLPFLLPYLEVRTIYDAWVIFLGLLTAIMCSIIGLIFGLKGLKLSPKILVVVGIVLSLIGLLFSTYLFLGWLTVGGPTEL
jgi:hypothetical protein